MSKFSAHTINDVEAQAVAMKAEGAKMKQIMAETGLNHSQAERAIMKATITDAEVQAFGEGHADLASAVKAARKGSAPLSWGPISIMASRYFGGEISESAARRAFTEATGLKHQGQRIGKGGRFYYGDGELYVDTLRPTGTDIPKDAVGREAARLSAITQRMLGLDMAELKALAADYGVEVKKGMTKARIVQAIRKAQQA